MSSTDKSYRFKVTLCSTSDINVDTQDCKKKPQDNFEMAPDRLKLGKGSFGTVFKAIYKGQNVAVKIVNKSKDSKKMSDVIENEANILNWDHENIIKILSINLTEKFGVIIMERFRGQCLQSIIDQIELSVYLRFRIMNSIICGLNYCHQNNILHLDIKPQNILVAFNVRDVETNIIENYSCKICDFGSSRKISYYSPENLTKIESSSYNLPGGTIRYMSPEALKNERLTPASDIYSFGITMWQLKARSPPYIDITSNDTVAYKVVKNNLRPTTPTDEFENGFEFDSTHHDCLCQHFSSEIRHYKPISLNSNDSKSKTNNIFQTFKSNISSENIIKNNTVKQLNQNMSLELDLYWNSDESSSTSEEEDIEIRSVFQRYHRITEIDVKEQQYKTIYFKCWNHIPEQRPSGINIENQLKSLI